MGARDPRFEPGLGPSFCYSFFSNPEEGSSHQSGHLDIVPRGIKVGTAELPVASDDGLTPGNGWHVLIRKPPTPTRETAGRTSLFNKNGLGGGVVGKPKLKQ